MQEFAGERRKESKQTGKMLQVIEREEAGKRALQQQCERQALIAWGENVSVVGEEGARLG